MQFDTREIAEIAATQTARPRLDLYASIHKALRAFMADTLLALGRMDMDDEPERTRTCAQVLELLAFCRSHLEHENRFMHPAMEARAPGTSQRIGGEHEAHEQDIARLAADTAALMAASGPERGAQAHALYTALAAFVGHNHTHMQVEETAHNAALWAHYSDAELMALHNNLVASIPPQEMMLTMRWMIPAVSPAERAAMLADIRAQAPAPAFAAVIDTVRPHLTPAEWGKLETALG